MKITLIRSNLAFMISLFLVFLLSSCSDDNNQTAHNSFDHEHGIEVTDLVKHKFEHDFAEQCVAREIHGSNNKDVDRQRFTKPCMCIASYMMKDLTAVEAEKFLQEQKNTQSLRIRFENAAYHCLQKKSRANQAPVIFKQR